MVYQYIGFSEDTIVYLIRAYKELGDQEIDRLSSLLDCIRIEEEITEHGKKCVRGPRIGTISPANSNLVAAYDAMSHTHGVMVSIEGYTLVDTTGDQDIDVMTEGVYTLDELLGAEQAIQPHLDPELLEGITINDRLFEVFSIDLVHALNKYYGLALTQHQMQYFVETFTSEKYNRTPTLSELYLFAQLNSEHCRHNIFNGRLIIDGETYEKSLFHHIKDTYKAHPGDVIVAYSDNGAILKAADDQYIVIKAETHNHPCLIAPFPGGATGSGGCFRDIMATGRGSMVEVSMSAYCVGDVTKETPYRADHQTPATILQEASRGVNDYGNCFAAPLINGSTIAVLEDLELGGELFSHAKPVVMAGSAGWTHVGAVDKQRDPGLVHVKLGGPDYAIGIGGAAASSMNSGENSGDLDFASVQRANPQMQIKVKKVLETIMTICPDAIRSIHDYGAGGHGTNIFELFEGDEEYRGGGEVDIAKISVEDASMTYHQILINESQERLGLLIHPSYMEQITTICEREKCPFDVLGQATDTGIVRMYDSRTGKDIVHVAVDDMLVRDRVEFSDVSPSHTPDTLENKKIEGIDLLDILRHPTVGSKGYIVHHVDRSVRGNIVQQQTVGPRQLPLADYGLFKTNPHHLWGTVVSQGMRPYHTLISPAIMSQWSLAETILNLSFVKSKGLDALSLSGNWMWSAKHPSGKATLHEAVEALSIHSQELGINIPVGKDSMSMKVTTDAGDDVNAPGTLILSGYLHVPDVTKRVTPELKNEESSLVWFPCRSAGNKPLSPTSLGISPSQGRQSLSHTLELGLNGSIAGLLTSQLGDVLPEIAMDDVKNSYELIQELLEKNQIIAGHDISDGGLWACLVEMYIAGEVSSLDVHVSGEHEAEAKSLLMSEYPGLVVQVVGDVSIILENAQKKYGLAGYILGNCGNTKHNGEERLTMTRGDEGNSGVMSWTKKKLLQAWSAYNTKIATTNAEELFVFPKITSPQTPLLEGDGLPASSRMTVVGQAKPKIMVLRDEGTNGEHDMMTAFALAGCEPIDVTMTDLQEKRTTLDQYQGLVLPGGFSYGDRPRSGKSFAEVIRHNPLLADQFASFRQEGKFALGVCNGNQVLMELGWITDSYGEQIMPMEHNNSGLFESRFLALQITDTDNRFFTGMDGWTLPVWVAHGEGKYADALSSNETIRVPVRYVDNTGQPTTVYPYNPNGSLGGVAGVLSADGNVLGMMPHPERTILPHQMAYIPQGQDPETLSWLSMFKNIRNSL